MILMQQSWIIDLSPQTNQLVLVAHFFIPLLTTSKFLPTLSSYILHDLEKIQDNTKFLILSYHTAFN